MALSLAFSECMRAVTGSTALRAEAVLLPNALTQVCSTICHNGLAICLQQGLWFIRLVQLRQTQLIDLLHQLRNQLPPEGRGYQCQGRHLRLAVEVVFLRI